jgi:hypothetical protein
MKKIAFLLIIITVATSSCEYLRKKGIIGNKKRMAEYIASLENAKKDDSLNYAAQLDRLKKDAQAKIDSVQKCCGTSGKYHIITGSFLNPVNAENYNKEMNKMGYHSSIIVASNGFNLVSAYNGDNYNEVINSLTNIRTAVNQESWLYLSN